MSSDWGYVVIEENTLAMNGCFRREEEAHLSAKRLGKRYEGSSWRVRPVKRLEKIGPGKFPPDYRWHANEPKVSELRALSK